MGYAGVRRRQAWLGAQRGYDRPQDQVGQGAERSCMHSLVGQVLVTCAYLVRLLSAKSHGRARAKVFSSYSYCNEMTNGKKNGEERVMHIGCEKGYVG